MSSISHRLQPYYKQLHRRLQLSRSTHNLLQSCRCMCRSHKRHNNFGQPPFEQSRCNFRYKLLCISQVNYTASHCINCHKLFTIELGLIFHALQSCLVYFTFKWQSANTLLLIMLQCFNAHACLCEYNLQGLFGTLVLGHSGEFFQLLPNSTGFTTTSLFLVVKSFLIFPS